MSLLRKASIVTTPTSYENGKILSVKPSIVLGEELVTNGDFATDSDWIKANATISNGLATITVTNGGYSALNQSITYATGKKYIITAQIQGLSGSSGKQIKFQDKGDNTGGLNQGNGLITLDETLQNIEISWTANSNSNIIVITRQSNSGNYSFTIDNVSIKEVLDADFDFTRNSSATRVNSQGLIEDMQILSGDLVSNGDFSQEGSELVTNGDFSDGTNGWSGQYSATISVVNSQLQVYNNQNGQSRSSQGITTVIGKSYNLKGTITNVDNSNGIQIKISNNSNLNSAYFNSAFNTTTNSVKVEHTFIATSTTTYIGTAQTGVIGNTGFLDNVSVKEVGQDWTFLGDFETDGTKALITNASQYSQLTNQIGVNYLLSGNKYRLTFDIPTLSISGAFAYRYTGGSVTPILTTDIQNGKFTTDFIMPSDGYLWFQTTGSYAGLNATITNISVIEITDDTNLPRIDYTGGEGHWLFEPQSTNLFPYSNDFSQWNSNAGASVINNALVSPDGTLNADEFVFDGTNNGRIEKNISTTNGLDYTFSIYLKNKDIANPTQVFIGNESSSEGRFVTITNEWQRFTNTQTVNETTEYPRVNYNGVGSLYAYGAQFEQQSFATSYIPTIGEVNGVTRLADAASGAGSSDLINSTSGVFYAEIAALDSVGSDREITISDGTTDNRVMITYSSNNIRVNYRANSVNIFDRTFNTTITDYNKIALKWKLNDFSFYVNGTEISTSTIGSVLPPNTLNTLNYDDGSSGFPFFGKTKCVAVFKEALTDAELTCLTTI